MEDRVQRRIGPAPAENFQALLPAAHTGQPIVDKDESQLSGIHTVCFLRDHGTFLRAGLEVYLGSGGWQRPGLLGREAKMQSISIKCHNMLLSHALRTQSLPIHVISFMSMS